MKILFSPSESKNDLSPFNENIVNSLWNQELFNYRKKCIEKYNELIKSKNEKLITKLTGLKNFSNLLSISFDSTSTQKAILRYDGVAYKYLDYLSLDEKSQNFIDNNVLIFSNLLGPILAKDNIPNYKLKQGENLGEISTHDHYKKYFTSAIDDLLKNEFIIDLRAEFYSKFYKINFLHVGFRFIKNGKVVSHFAKAYRGIVLRELAKYRPQNEQEFGKINIKNLTLKEIRKTKIKTEYIFEIKT